jgi:hypothetical protein
MDYTTNLACPGCSTIAETDINLTDAQHLTHGYVDKEAEEALEGVVGPTATGNYFITLPQTQAVFEVRLMTGREERLFAKRIETRKKKKQAEAMMTDQFKTFTVSINSIDIVRQMYSFIDNLPVKDSRFLRTAYNNLSPAMQLKHDFVCGECGYEQEVEVPITAQFFWPDI